MTDGCFAADVCFVAWRVLFDPPVPVEMSRSLAFWHLELQAGNHTPQQAAYIPDYAAIHKRISRNEIRDTPKTGSHPGPH
jgi:hypothetical protein